jgi:hypothetical protein
MRMIVEREFENDNIAVADGPVGEQVLIPGPGAFEYKLVHKKVIAYQQRGFHRLGGDLERLDDERGSKQGKQNGDQQRINEIDEAANRVLAPDPDGKRFGLW